MHELIATEDDQDFDRDSKALSWSNPRQRAWIEVEPAAISENVRKLKTILREECLFLAVVKADGYGHGAQTVAQAALSGGADKLGVATLQEGIELRKKGLQCPILVLGNLFDQEELYACLYWNLIPTLSSIREVYICDAHADVKKKKFPVQIKVDTGMSRLGCNIEDLLTLVDLVDKSDYLELEGVYSHLALADNQFQYDIGSETYKQKKRFDSLLGSIRKKYKNCCFHLANSAGTFLGHDFHYDMVRVGLALYGYNPFPTPSKFQSLDLKPALSVKAKITLIREVPSGTGVSYGHKFQAHRLTRLAVVGIGYADGVSSLLSGKISGLCQGKLLPQVGSITMDMLMLDVTDHPDIEVGSVVTMLGREGDRFLTPLEWCNLSGSIPWEVLCGFKNRLPRLVV